MNLPVVASTVQKTQHWVQDLMNFGNFATEQEAWLALRVVLHALRDRLVVDEAAQLAAELPMLIRGLYFEGWDPNLPTELRTREEFLADVQARLRNDTRLEPEEACRAVFALLSREIQSGEIRDVRRMLPAEVQEMWPPDVGPEPVRPAARPQSPRK